MINQEGLQTTPNNPKTIVFPENIAILLNNNNFKQHEQILKTTEFDIDEKPISIVKNIKAAAEIVNYLINLALKKNAIVSIQNVMAQLLINYKYEEIKDNRLLDKYEIEKLSEKDFIYKIGKNTHHTLLKPNPTVNLDFNESIFLKINATRLAINIAIKNKHKQTVEELIKELLKNADLHLTLFSRTNYSKYNEASEIITSSLYIRA
ncbi:MAG: hypothetical protein RCO49_02735 [Rickettsia endosymbiont of Argas persicus]